MARLSPLDASFLRIESPTAHMHVGWLSHLTLPEGADALNVDRLTRTLAARLHLVPRFRQRVMFAPLDLGEPAWVDDPRFSLARHLYVADGGPVDKRAFRAMTDAFLSRPLPRERPLWQILLVPRLRGGGAAVLGKVHHAMCDGIAAVELGMLLFDGEADPPPEEAPPWGAEPVTGPLRSAIDSVAATAAGGARAAGQVARLAAAPRDSLRAAESGGRAALSLAGDALRSAPASYLNQDLTPARTLVTQRLAMADLQSVKRTRGVKLNDVVLAVVAGALRGLALLRGDAPSDLRVMIPVSTRREGDDGGNRITFCFTTLPVGAAEPIERLRLIRASTLAIKRSGEAAGSEMVLRSLGQLPVAARAPAARLAASPRLFNLTVSNVPGPPVPLYAAGARVACVFPVIPLAERHALAFGALSYDGGMQFAAHADPAALPEVVKLPSLLSVALLELIEASHGRAHGGPERNGRRPSARVRGAPVPGRVHG
jgi:diacylglycerol O-acyltransferase